MSDRFPQASLSEHLFYGIQFFPMLGVFPLSLIMTIVGAGSLFDVPGFEEIRDMTPFDHLTDELISTAVSAVLTVYSVFILRGFYRNMRSVCG